MKLGHHTYILLSALLLLAFYVDYPVDYFRSPLDIDLKISGTFGELRSNHFHAGLDIKTNKQTGLKVYAVADGYVSRVNVSTSGENYWIGPATLTIRGHIDNVKPAHIP